MTGADQARRLLATFLDLAGPEGRLAIWLIFIVGTALITDAVIRAAVSWLRARPNGSFRR